MRRLFALALTFAVAFLLLAGLATSKRDVPTQFQGYVTYMNNGQPMPIGTPVKAYLGGVLKGQTTVQQSDGYYRITGENEDFPSGTYNLISDDGYNYGTNNCSHTETQTTNCNIQTVPYSP